jgi:hypothetical protein
MMEIFTALFQIAAAIILYLKKKTRMERHLRKIELHLDKSTNALEKKDDLRGKNELGG